MAVAKKKIKKTNKKTLPNLRQSAINTYHTCNLQYYFEYMKKQEPDDKFEFFNTMYGSVFHRICEIIFTEGNKELDPEKHSIDEIDEKLRPIFRSMIVEEVDKAKDEGKHIRGLKPFNFNNQIEMFVYHARMSMRKLLRTEFYKPYVKFLPEQYIEAKTDLFNITGTIDLVAFREDGTYDLFDFKTGRFFEEKAIEENYQVQFYNFLSNQQFGLYPSNFTFLITKRHDARLTIYSVDAEYGEPVDKLFFKSINKFHKEITTTRTFKKLDPEQNDIMCAFCQFQESCKKYPQ